ncbi:MAG: maleate cis-trans isomerase [Mycobacterium sp.]
MPDIRRIGLIVPSSNVTVETEMPAILSRVPGVEFTFHSSRMRLHSVTAEQLRAMNAQRERCVLEIGDAGVDAVLYACLVAIMATGLGEHHDVELAIAEQLAAGGSRTKVLSSAGALVTALKDAGWQRVALVMPYLRPMAEKVVAYLENEGIEVVDWRALEVADNAEVGCIAAERVLEAAHDLDLTRAEAVVVSACVQMPSLSIVETAERELGLPALSASTAGVYCLLRGLGLPVDIPGAGALLRADAALPV